MKNLGVMVDYSCCVVFWQWKSKEDIRNYIKKCKQTGIQLLVLRLSETGDFVHRTKLARQVAERYGTDDKEGSIYRELDVLKVFSELTRGSGIKLFAWFTMSDEGWFPRFRSLAENVREHYRHILGTEEEIKDLDKWISRPTPEEYGKIIPAVDMGGAVPADAPWSFYSRFARAHPEYLCRNRLGHGIGRRLSYAFEEVRKYRIAMIEEAVGYGIDGIWLDFTRWAVADIKSVDADGVNVFGYEEPNIQGFLGQYGIDPRTISNADPRWIEFRVQNGPTRFMRDLNEKLGDKRKKIKLAVMVFGDQNREQAFTDPGSWAKEKLVDIITTYEIPGQWRGIDDPSVGKEWLKDPPAIMKAWKKRVGKLCELYCCMKPTYYFDKGVYFQRHMTSAELKSIIGNIFKAGADGITFYEADNLREPMFWVIGELTGGPPYKTILENYRKKIGLSCNVKPNQIVSGVLRVSVRPEPEHFELGSIEFFIDGESVKAVFAAPVICGSRGGAASDHRISDALNFSWNTRAVPNGKHTIRAVGRLMELKAVLEIEVCVKND